MQYFMRMGDTDLISFGVLPGLVLSSLKKARQWCWHPPEYLRTAAVLQDDFNGGRGSKSVSSWTFLSGFSWGASAKTPFVRQWRVCNNFV